MRALLDEMNRITDYGDTNLYDIPEELVAKWLVDAVRPAVLDEIADEIDHSPMFVDSAHREATVHLIRTMARIECGK